MLVVDVEGRTIEISGGNGNPGAVERPISREELWTISATNGVRRIACRSWTCSRSTGL